MRYLLLAGFLSLFPLALAVRAADSAVVLPDCVVSLADEVAVPAQEAGVLVKIPVRDGQQVTKGDLLAQIDDIVPRAKQNVAMYKLKAALKEATDDINKRFSEASADVAYADCMQDSEANRKIPAPCNRPRCASICWSTAKWCSPLRRRSRTWTWPNCRPA